MGDQKQKDHRERFFRDFHDRHLRHRARHEKVDADRRRDEADREIDDHEDAEMHCVHAVGGDDRHQDRREDQDGRTGVHNHADDQQKQVDDEQDRKTCRERAGHPCGDGLRHMHQRQDARKRNGCREDEQDRAEGPHRLSQHIPEVAELQRPVNEYADDQRVEDRDHGGFGRGGHAGVNTSEDDNRGQKSEEA